MSVKTKNLLTASLLGLLAFGFYIYAMPAEVVEHLLKAVKSMF